MGACKECGCKDGDRGPIGPAGLKGDAGLPGNDGAQGIPGIPGVQGIQGPQGEQGEQGPPGNDGGSLPGPTGATGDQGPQGDKGDDGPSGLDGDDGADGANGQGRLNYYIDNNASAHIETPVANTGIILKNSGYATIELPLLAELGDQISVVGTSYTTAGWRIQASGNDQIQMTNSPSPLQTTPGGYVEPDTFNYADVIHLISDGEGNWIITDKIFFNGTIPYFS